VLTAATFSAECSQSYKLHVFSYKTNYIYLHQNRKKHWNIYILVSHILNSNVISSPGTLRWSTFLSCCNYY